ncbi:MAG: hypothetical protein PHY14_01880 [Candidatus Gracilibacteria bacterium]|nr:hypothetical protein [Candidatus Gracilibacteria bacterium]
MSAKKTSDVKNDKFREDILKLIDSNLTAIRNPVIKQLIILNPEYEGDLKSEHLRKIENQILEIEVVLKELSPFVYNIRNSISDITGNNPTCAIYLLLCSCIESFKAIVILGKSGFYQEIMTINRKLEEAMTQCEVFMHDNNEDIITNFNKWFSGAIISHSVGREKIGALHKNTDVNVESLGNYIYRMESNVSHNGYIGMLEMISPFTKDYDLVGSTRFHRTAGAIGHTIGKLTHFTILLKGIYLYLFKDFKTFDKIDIILKSHSPDIGNLKVSEKMKKDFPKT